MRLQVRAGSGPLEAGVQVLSAPSSAPSSHTSGYSPMFQTVPSSSWA
jgi:hypothetical protein